MFSTLRLTKMAGSFHPQLLNYQLLTWFVHIHHVTGLHMYKSAQTFHNNGQLSLFCLINLLSWQITLAFFLTSYWLEINNEIIHKGIHQKQYINRSKLKMYLSSFHIILHILSIHILYADVIKWQINQFQPNTSVIKWQLYPSRNRYNIWCQLWDKDAQFVISAARLLMVCCLYSWYLHKDLSLVQLGYW